MCVGGGGGEAVILASVASNYFSYVFRNNMDITMRKYFFPKGSPFAPPFVKVTEHMEVFQYTIKGKWRKVHTH